MRKLTRGYILLTLLVLTGFAGQVSNQTISSKERTELVSRLKQTKKTLLESVEDLTPAQLSFKPAANKHSIAEHVSELAKTQAALLGKVEAAIDGDPTSGAISMQSKSDLAGDELTDAVNASQSRLVKYAKTTTEDLHGYTILTAEGEIDAYKALLILPVLTEGCLTEIEKIKRHPHFPR